MSRRPPFGTGRHTCITLSFLYKRCMFRSEYLPGFLHVMTSQSSLKQFTFYPLCRAFCVFPSPASQMPIPLQRSLVIQGLPAGFSYPAQRALSTCRRQLLNPGVSRVVSQWSHSAGHSTLEEALGGLFEYMSE